MYTPRVISRAQDIISKLAAMERLRELLHPLKNILLCIKGLYSTIDEGLLLVFKNKDINKLSELLDPIRNC